MDGKDLGGARDLELQGHGDGREVLGGTLLLTQDRAQQGRRPLQGRGLRESAEESGGGGRRRGSAPTDPGGGDGLVGHAVPVGYLHHRQYRAHTQAQVRAAVGNERSQRGDGRRLVRRRVGMRGDDDDMPIEHRTANSQADVADAGLDRREDLIASAREALIELLREDQIAYALEALIEGAAPQSTMHTCVIAASRTVERELRMRCTASI
ncbi:hypothetical protein [Streptomyces sp. NBC_00147]|uniref:hypothetical protein n=2 Tax=Streptomyces TaxID=1883 RepID=UPI00324BE651